MQDLQTVGVEAGVLSAGVQTVGGRTGGAGTVEKRRSGTSRKSRTRSFWCIVIRLDRTRTQCHRNYIVSLQK